MRLLQILENVNFTVLQGNADLEINNIQYDSRNIKAGNLFFCIEGTNIDGHKFAMKAVENGAAAVVCTRAVDVPSNVTVIMVKDDRKTLAIASSNFYGKPAESLRLIGVTGTNGKTTSTFMIKSILEEAGYKVGLVGTIANYIGNRKIEAHRTTPESLELHKLFKDMVEEGIDYCVMEVSSHSLSLDRVYGLEFNESIFTNLTRDHLDFHKTFENYYNAKLKLFRISKNCIINLDDSYGTKIMEDITANKITFGLGNTANITAVNINSHARGLDFDVVFNKDKEHIRLGIPGMYNVYNSLGSIAVCINEGVKLHTIKAAMEKVFVPGRCEIVTKGYTLGYEVIVDYAHTPDGLENILKTAKEFTKGKLICVFGCGGDRDKTKRPIMGQIASNLSDLAIVTSDNPRTEDPELIIKDILGGIEKDNYTVVENRREAIKKAMELAEKDDVVVIAGKGHEDYQILKHKTIHFDEREVIAEIIKELY